MGGFPGFVPEASTSNPYIGAASEYSSSAAHLAASLREAAQQQQQAQQTAKEKQAADYSAGLQRDFENQIQMADKGFVPTQSYADLPGGQPAANRPTLMTPEANPAAADSDGTTVTDPQGRTYAKVNKNKLDDSNSFVVSPTVAQAMNEYGITSVKSGDRFPLAHAGLATEAVKAHIGKTQLDDTNSVTVTQDMADRLAPHGITLRPGARVSLEKAADLKNLVEIGEPKAEKPDASQVIPGMVGPKGGPLLLDKAKGTASEVPVPAGSRQQESLAAKDANQRFQDRQQDRQDARDQRQQDQQQKGRDAAQKTIDALQTKEQEQHAKRQAYGSALSVPNGKPVVDPDSQKQYTMNDARRKFYQDRYGNATDLAGSFADQQKKLIARNGGGDQPAADAPKSAKTSQDANVSRATSAPAQLKTGHKVGDSVRLKSGKTVTISTINPDGSFEGQ